jgi:glycosyltransferase involved in cell wall biosynthesis
MKTILINGIASKSGGGRSILTNFLNSVPKDFHGYEFVIVVPDHCGYDRYSSKNIRVISYGFNKLTLLKHLYFYFFIINKLCRRYKVDLILNLSDVIIPTKTKQFFLFDWPYAVYPESEVWSRISGKEYFLRRLKLLLFNRYKGIPELILAQTESVKRRLMSLYKLDNIEIIPNAVSVDNITGGVNKEFNLPLSKTKFLCLSRYYEHKNLEIFIPLAKLFKEKKLDFCVVITIDPTQCSNSARLIEEINNSNLQEFIINVGEIEMINIPSLFHQVDSFILPTLLESFSGTYVEAMFHKKPIFTSNMDFALDVCKDAAVYFDPHDVVSILSAMLKFHESDKMDEIVQNGLKRIKELPSWEAVYEKLMDLILERK